MRNEKEQLLEVIRRITESKRKQKTIRESFRSEFEQSPKWREHTEEIKRIKGERALIEGSLLSKFQKDQEELDSLKREIKNDMEVLSDMALNAYVKGVSLEIEDDDEEVTYEPRIRITFSRQMTLL